MILDKLHQYLKIKKKKYLIFDFDKTLITLKMNWENWYKEILSIFLEYDPFFTGKTKKDLELAVNDFVRRFGENARRRLLEFNKKYEQNHLRGYTKNELLLKFIRENKEYDLFLWSSNDSTTARPIMKKEDILKKFKKTIFRDEVVFIKPNLEGFRLINISKNPREDYLFIGDSFTDKQAAKDAGIDFLKVDNLT